MKKTNYKWVVSDTTNIPENDKKKLTKENIPEIVSSILWNRGIKTSEEIQTFLNPSLDDLHDPYLLFDMERAVERVQRAVVEGERILVYGDYDADGITSTTIVKEALELLGADVETYLPNRFSDGYGPNKRVYQEKIDSGIQLILTVDNGVSGHEAIDYANERGVDVVVTDHHELSDILPNAYAIIHPRHPKGTYPFKDLAGVGVAFKLICALLDELVVEALDLVAVGTIADMVSLTGENRILVSCGIKMIQQTQRIGLLELLNQASASKTEVTDQTIGFTIAPRLNALGRMSDPNPAVELLSTFDEFRAKELAQMIEMFNDERKKLVEEVVKEASSQISDENQIHLLIGENWHEGILGIVAGRIMQTTGKPTIVLTKLNEFHAKGSGRSVSQINLFEYLQTMSDYFVAFGGHHSAVGLTVKIEHLDDMQEKLNQLVVKSGIDFSAGMILDIDSEIMIEDATVPFIKSLQKLAPFGMDNPFPRFLVKNVVMDMVKLIGTNQQHVKFNFMVDNLKMDGIAFQFGEFVTDFYADKLSLVGELSINEWNGYTKPQLMLKDYALNGPQVFDFRAKKAQLPLSLNKETTAWLSFVNKPTAFQKNVTSPIIRLGDFVNNHELANKLKGYQNIVYLDCPKDLAYIQQVYRVTKDTNHYFIFEASDDAYLDGMGTREQYTKLFSLIRKQKQLDIRFKLKDIAKYLNLPEKLLIFMIQVFFELKFVTIDDGVLTYVENAVSQPLENSTLYQERLRNIKNQTFLQLTDLSNLKEWFFS